MIQKESMLNVADNSGAKQVKVIALIGSTRKRYAYLGDLVKVAVKKAITGGSVKKGEVANGIVVRTRKEVRRPNGSYIRFDDNAVVLLNKDLEPVGTRVFGPVGSELKSKMGFEKILSLAPQVF